MKNYKKTATNSECKKGFYREIRVKMTLLLQEMNQFQKGCRVSIKFTQYTCPHACNNLRTASQILIKFDDCQILKQLSSHLNLNVYQ
jgi:hypothetical protein